MPSTNSNNATWYMLRYPIDFAPRTSTAGDPVPPQFVPSSSPTLFYDNDRHVLELVPVKPSQELTPLPGVALDIDGETYRVCPTTGQILVRRCNGSEAPLICQQGVLGAPCGLALDRRGYLYSADPGFRRVIVLIPDDATSVAVLVEGLTDPVDVAVDPGGRIYVADRAGGKVVMYDAGFRPIGQFKSQDASGLPVVPRPISVMIDSSGSVLVADANHPRILRFSPDGNPLGDSALSTLVKPLEAKGISIADPLTILPGSPGLFVAGTCRPPFATDDGGVLLAQIHRYLRLLRLHLNSSYETSGVVLTAAFDSKAPGTIWHKIVMDAQLPAGTSIIVETCTSENVSSLATQLSGSQAGTDLAWSSPTSNGSPIPYTNLVPDQLVQSPPGRYMRLRITLSSNGQATPSLRWLKLIYPRGSYLDSLPRVYQRDPDSALFLQHFLALFEKVLTGVEDRYEEFSRWLNPQAAPMEVINWLGLLIDLTFDPSWSLARRRILVSEAIDLYSRRGTVGGLERYIEIYCGVKPVILEAFLNRPAQPGMLGRAGTFLGGSFPLSASTGALVPALSLASAYAHRFTVLVYADDECTGQQLLPVVNQIITVNKPAHTVHTLKAIYPDSRVGSQSTIGVDFVAGGGTPRRTRLGGKSPSGLPAKGAGILGVDSVLGNQRPEYTQPIKQEI